MRFPQCCALLLPAFLLHAEPRWIRIHSEHFEMLSSGGAGSTKDVLRNFEQIRGFFQDALKFTPKPGQAVKIIAITNVKEFEKYRPSESASAFFSPRPMADYIVLSDLGDAAFRVAVHEYFHLLVHQSELKLPLWFNEGLAELYSTLQPLSDQMLVGVPPRGRREAALAQKWIPLEAMLTAGHDSSLYNEKKSTPGFYAESWGLAHMLVLSEDYGPGFVAFFREVTSGASGAAAFQAVYKKPLPDADKDLQTYLRRADFRGQLHKLKLEKRAETGEPSVAEEYDVRVELANLLANSRAQEARKELEPLIASRPDRPEAHAALAYLEWSQMRSKEALEHMRPAYRAGVRTPRLLFDLGRLAGAADPALATEALEIEREIGDRTHGGHASDRVLR